MKAEKGPDAASPMSMVMMSFPTLSQLALVEELTLSRGARLPLARERKRATIATMGVAVDSVRILGMQRYVRLWRVASAGKQGRRYPQGPFPTTLPVRFAAAVDATHLEPATAIVAFTASP